MASRRNGKGTLREEAVNTLLAEQLRRHGLSARAERRSREGTPDVRIELRRGDLLLLVCKWKGSAGLLDEQVHQRLEQFPEALGVLGVVYPDHFSRRTTFTQRSVSPEIYVGGYTGRAELSPQVRLAATAPSRTLLLSFVIFPWNWREPITSTPRLQLSAMPSRGRLNPSGSTKGWLGESPT